MTEETKTLKEFKLYAECKKGTSFKFYELVAQETESGATLVANYGRIGSKGQTKHYGRFLSVGNARLKAEVLFHDKLRKGYVEVSALEALASACEEPEDRLESSPTQPHEVVLPLWRTGNQSTDDRLDKLGNEVLLKLNLTRADRFKYDYRGNSYTKEVKRLLKSFKGAYTRLETSKTHGPFCTEHTAQSVRRFFSVLTEYFCQGLGWNNL